MDDLEFRRAIYADPNSKDDDIRQAAASNAGRQEFWSDMKKLDSAMCQASKVEVPQDLAHKLIWQQSMHRFAKQKQRSRVQLALAASVAFVVGVSFTLWQQQTDAGLINLSAPALSHVHYTEDHELSARGNLSMQLVNQKMDSLIGAHFSGEIGRIYSANYCEVEDIKALHLVMESGNGKVTVFVIPKKEGYINQPSFSDDRFIGRSLEYDKASLILVGEKKQVFAQFEEKLKSKLVFSA